MPSFALFWLASAAIIALMFLWARANHRHGWRRPRAGAESTPLREFIELHEELHQGTAQAACAPVVALAPLASPPDTGSLVALEAALRRVLPAQEAPPSDPSGETAEERVPAL